jgi:peptidoglycan DL-endopeptidase CwlO
MIIALFRRNNKTHAFLALTTLLSVHPLTANAFTYEKNYIQDYSSIPYSENSVETQNIIIIGANDAYDEAMLPDRGSYEVSSAEHVRLYGWDETEPGDVVATARKLVGKPYIFASSNPRNGFDCSGLIRFVYGSAEKIYLPHSATQQATLGKQISESEAKPGDLVAYGSPGNYGHIGIYSGDGQIIHSARSQGGVKETSVNRIPGPKVYIQVVKHNNQ